MNRMQRESVLNGVIYCVSYLYHHCTTLIGTVVFSVVRLFGRDGYKKPKIRPKVSSPTNPTILDILQAIKEHKSAQYVLQLLDEQVYEPIPNSNDQQFNGKQSRREKLSRQDGINRVFCPHSQTRARGVHTGFSILHLAVAYQR